MQEASRRYSTLFLGYAIIEDSFLEASWSALTSIDHLDVVQYSCYLCTEAPSQFVALSPSKLSAQHEVIFYAVS